FESIEAQTEDLYFQPQILEDLVYHVAIVSKSAGPDTVDHESIFYAGPVRFNEVAQMGLERQTDRLRGRFDA
ncbi:MAG: hypothetical protein Q8M56_09430, partial [Desulfobacterales bacterium]|nr:hypothetical protein [Desulfobacterales bacterium]